MREKLKAARVPSPKYNAVTRETMKNSLTLPQDEVQKRIDSGLPYVIRLKVPPKREVRLKDMVRGWVMVHSSEIDDKVLMKSDGMPTYHLANVVDDHLMGITHVIRGEEWLPSAPLHVLLYEYLGWTDSMPQFAHLPLLLKPDGNGKLSKRDAEKHGFPIFPLAWEDPNSGEKVEGFRESGYLPDAFINFLAFLGWNPGTHEELFTLEELTNAFSVERIGKSGVKFDINKAKWYNQQYIKQKPDEALAAFLREDLKKENILCDESDMVKICALMKERVTFPHDFWENGKFFFEAPSQYDPKVIRKKWTTESASVLKDYEKNIASLTELDAASAKNALVEAVEKNNQSLGAVMQVVRVAITGLGAGPDLMEIIEIIGKDETLYRIRLAFEKIGELLSRADA